MIKTAAWRPILLQVSALKSHNETRRKAHAVACSEEVVSLFSEGVVN